MLLLFREQAVHPVNGMGDPEDYGLARENNRRFRDTFIRLAKDEEEKELFKESMAILRIWEYLRSNEGVFYKTFRADCPNVDFRRIAEIMNFRLSGLAVMGVIIYAPVFLNLLLVVVADEFKSVVSNVTTRKIEQSRPNQLDGT